MTVGNLVALRQTNIVRMLAYSSIAQGGFILVPLAVAGDGAAAQASFEAVVIYLLIYARHEPRRVRGRDRRGPQDALGRDHLVRRACSATRPGWPC